MGVHKSGRLRTKYVSVLFCHCENFCPFLHTVSDAKPSPAFQFHYVFIQRQDAMFRFALHDIHETPQFHEFKSLGNH